MSPRKATVSLASSGTERHPGVTIPDRQAVCRKDTETLAFMG
jgi:hypothetical protein